ncbi:MAG TPA: methyltransferase [Thermodesulfobacteriota bacterium]|nr:methyltransferase [Thermodesulfobacteriota bacterium]
MNSNLNLKDLIRMTHVFRISKALFVAHELGIFDRLANGEKGASELAHEISASEKVMAGFCNALSGIGLLVKKGDMYFLPDNLRAFLLKDSDRSFRNYIGMSHDVWNIWSDLERVIKEGKPVTTFMEIIYKDESKLRTYIHAMHERAREFSPLILEMVDTSNRKRMLDIGGGSGTYSFEWMKRYPQLRSTILDLPEVLEIAKDYMKGYGLEDRVSFISGNYYELDIGQGEYDIVLMANVLHDGVEENKSLLRKAYNALEESGIAIIHGFALDESECEPVGSALIQLSMSPDENVYKKSEYVKWLEEAGFKDIQCFEIDELTSTAIPSSVIATVK